MFSGKAPLVSGLKPQGLTGMPPVL